MTGETLLFVALGMTAAFIIDAIGLNPFSLIGGLIEEVRRRLTKP